MSIRDPLRAEIKRKAIHVGLLIVIPAGRRVGEGRAVWVLVAGLGLCLLLEGIRRARGVLALVFYRLFRTSIRRPERRGVLGVTAFFAVASILAAVAPWPRVEIVIAVVLVGDAAAALVGRALRPRSPGRSWQGSAAYCVMGMLAAMALGAPTPAGLVLAMVAAASERLAGRLHVDDNWVAPPATLAAAVLLGLGTAP